MNQKAIDQALIRPGLKLMNHVVAGYPNINISRECIKTMEAAGSDMIEIQIPFSDPMADGLTIVKANHIALNQGMNLNTFWSWLSQVRKETHLPLLLMTYYNIPFKMGLKDFFSRAQDTGMSGLIIPDLPLDNPHEAFLEHIAPFNLYPIPVISPSVKKDRLQEIASLKLGGFIYTTLKVGITGSKKSHDSGIAFLDTVKEYFSIPIAAGFGIESLEDSLPLLGKADMAVVGSKIIRLLEESLTRNPKNPEATLEIALKEVYQFIKNFKTITIS